LNSFPKRYFSTPKEIQEVMKSKDYKSKITLEVGGNNNVDAKYSYDRFVKSKEAINVSLKKLAAMKFDYIILRNAISYLTKWELKIIIGSLNSGGMLIANTFKKSPEKQFRGDDAVYLDKDIINHHLYLDKDVIIKHAFYDRSLDF